MSASLLFKLPPKLRERQGEKVVGGGLSVGKVFSFFLFRGFLSFLPSINSFLGLHVLERNKKGPFLLKGPFQDQPFFGLNALYLHLIGRPQDLYHRLEGWRLFRFALHDWTKVQPLSFKLLQNCSGLKHVLTPFLLGLPGSVRRIRLHLRVRRPPLLRRWSWVRGVLLQPSVRGLQVSAGDKLRGGGGGRRSVQVGTSSYSKGNF